MRMTTTPSDGFAEDRVPPHATGGFDLAPAAPGDLMPEHLRAPAGLTQQVHEINALLTAIIIGAHADYQWLNGKRPDAEAAKRTSARLNKQIRHLYQLVEDLNVDLT